MDSNKFSTQVERLGVVETGRRRRWTDDEKLKIVLESMAFRLSLLAFFGNKVSAMTSVATVGVELSKGSHCRSGPEMGFVSPV